MTNRYLTIRDIINSKLATDYDLICRRCNHRAGRHYHPESKQYSSNACAVCAETKQQCPDFLFSPRILLPSILFRDRL